VGIEDKALEPVTQHQSLSVVLCLRNQGQQYGSQTGADFADLKDSMASAKSTILAIECGFSSV
jgi:hypothetical protein